MTLRLDLLGLVTADMAASLAFYRRLGLDLPAGADHDPHVDIVLPGGLRLAWDTVETVRSFDPGWTAPQGGHRTALAFRCDDAAEVDTVYADLTAGPPTSSTRRPSVPGSGCATSTYSALTRTSTTRRR
jgi:catechol 2,3-dioxygenase-like lactoylglutathione lyase family enzyme